MLLSIISSRFLHVGACDKISFYSKDSVIVHCVCILHFVDLFICQQTLGLPLLKSVVNSAAVDMNVRYLLESLCISQLSIVITNTERSSLRKKIFYLGLWLWRFAVQARLGGPVGAVSTEHVQR